MLPQVIPGKFVKHFGDKIEESITLESLGGYTFDVQVAKNMGRIVLQSRWKSFVSAHDLKKIDFLVFKYDGMYQMKVLIFDPSGCEKVPHVFSFFFQIDINIAFQLHARSGRQARQ